MTNIQKIINLIFNRLHGSKAGRSESGQSLVEFAVTFFLLLLILAGTVDIGRALFTYIALRDAAQEGAAFASLCPDDATKIEYRIRNISSAPVDFTSPDITFTCAFVEGGSCGTPGAVPGTDVQVDVYYNNFQITMPLAGVFTGDSITLHATAKDTILQDTCPVFTR